MRGILQLPWRRSCAWLGRSVPRHPRWPSPGSAAGRASSFPPWGRALAQLKDNMDALDHTMSEELLARLDEVSSIGLGFPHEFTRNDFTRDIMFGETQDLIDDHRA